MESEGISVLRYDSDYRLKLSIPVANDGGLISGIAVGTDGSVFVSSYFDNKIFKIELIKPSSVPQPILEVAMRPVVTVEGLIGKAYNIEASTSLTGDWHSLGTLEMRSPREHWIDRNPVDGRKFYHALA